MGLGNYMTQVIWEKENIQKLMGLGKAVIWEKENIQKLMGLGKAIAFGINRRRRDLIWASDWKEREEQ